MTQDKLPLSRPSLLFLISLGVFLTFIYRGFYFPDQQYLRGASLPILLMGIRVIFPLGALALLGLLWACFTKRIKFSNILIICFASLLALLISYPPGSYWYYKRSFRHNFDGYHSYLQLTPPSFISPESEMEEVIRIFCLGGSSTAWPDSQGKDWPGRVEQILQKRYPDRKIEVHNLAKEWYTSLHTLINYSTNLQQHDPDILVVTHAINDLLHNADFSYFSGGEFREDYGHFYGPVSGIIHRKTLPETLFNLLRGSWYFSPREIVHTDIFPGIVSFKRNMATLAKLAKANGTEVLLLSQPNLYKDEMSAEELASLYMLNVEAVGPNKRWDYDTAHIGMKQYLAASKQVAEEMQLSFGDLESSVPKSQKYFRDDVHYRDEAFSLIAEGVAKELIRILEDKM